MLQQVGKRRWTMGVISALALIGAGAATAQGLAGAAALKDRQTHMKALGGAFKAIIDQTKSDTPDLAVIKTSAAKVAVAGHDLPSWFPKGSGPETGEKTTALPLIWTDAPGFATAAQAFEVQAGKMNALAQAGDIAGVKGEVMPLGQTCGGCHKKFRTPEQH